MEHSFSVKEQLVIKAPHYGLQMYKAVEQDHADELNNLLAAVSQDVEAPVFLNVALLRAAILGRDACAELLIAHGADSKSKEKAMNEKVLKGAKMGICTALLVAWTQHCESIQRCPAEHGQTRMNGDKFRETILGMDTSRSLLPAALRTRVEQMTVADCNTTLELLCEDHENTKAVGDTPLMLAAEAGCVPVMERLLGAGAGVNDTGTEGKTALHSAALNGQTEAVDLLLKHGAHISVKDCEDCTPLSYACLKMDSSTLRLLLGHLSQSDVNVQDKYGETLLFDVLRGRQHDHFRCLSHLLDKGVNVDHRNNKGYTALFMAVSLGKARVVYLLLKANCELNSKGNYLCRVTNKWENHTPFQVAVIHGYFIIARMLREAGCDVSMPRDLFRIAFQKYKICHWIMNSMDNAGTLREITRWKLRDVIGSRGFKDRVAALPLPEQMKQELLIPELDTLLEESGDSQVTTSHWSQCVFR